MSRQTFIVAVLMIVEVCTGCQQACYPPSNTLNSDWSNELQYLVLESRCYTACIEKYKDDIRPDDAYILNGNWLSVSYSTLEGLACSKLQQIMECKMGCIIKANNSHLTVAECRDECYNGCQNKCSSVSNCSYGNSFTCLRRCRGPPCRFGCEEFSQLVNDISQVPIPAVDPISIVLTELPGYYIPQNMSGNNENSLVTSFIYKIEDDMSVQYAWKPSLQESLDLRLYSCQYINISYAPVNKYGISDFSHVNNYCIVGEYHYPEQHEGELQFEYLEDLRDDFRGHAVVNISWKPPHGIEFLSHYEFIIVASSLSCGGYYNEPFTSQPISKNSTFFVYQAENPNDPPIFNCIYQTVLYSEPRKPNIDVKPQIIKPMLDSTVSELNVSCTKQFNIDNTLSLHVKLDLANVYQEIQAIEKFDITLYLNSSFSKSVTVSKQVNTLSYNVTLDNLLAYKRKLSYQYQVMITPVKNDTFFWRFIPNPVGCAEDASIPFSPPSGITNESVSLNYPLLNISWHPPSVTYGSIIMYELVIGQWPVLQSGQYHTFYIAGNVTSFIINITMLEYCQYLQIRSLNDYAWSNWSDSFQLSLDRLKEKESSMQLSSSVTSFIDMMSSSKYDLFSSSDAILRSSTNSFSLSATIPASFHPSITPEGPSAQSVITYTLYGIIFLISVLLLGMLFGSVIICIKCSRATTNISDEIFKQTSDSSQDKTQKRIYVVNKLAVDNLYTTFQNTSTQSHNKDFISTSV